MKKPRIVFVYSGGRKARWEALSRDDEPSEFFYGAVEMAQAGWHVNVVDFQDQPDAFSARLINLLLGRFFPVRVRAEHLLGVWRLRKVLAKADVLIATTSYIALAAGMLRLIGMRIPPVVAIHCGIANHRPTSLKRRVTSWILRNQECTFFAAAEAAETARLFHLPDSHVHANAFGVDIRFWKPSKIDHHAGYVLAVGNDARRDYFTLVKAASNWDVPVKILTKRDIEGSIPSNVELLRGSWHSPAVSDAELRDLYRDAAVVVVPIVDSVQPSGQSVALQAMACGRPVVMSETSGLWTDDDFRKDEHIVLVPPNEPSALAAGVQRLLENSTWAATIGNQACARMHERGDIKGFAERLGNVCLKATAWHDGISTVG